MSQIVDRINSSEYIYSTCTKWGLKKYSCNVAYYTEEPLDDLYYVICSILASNGGRYDKRSLGILLGFSIANREVDGKNEVYYDVAEVRMFEDILRLVEEEHLISKCESEDEIVLTKLGEVSLKQLKHYNFFLGKQDVYEHALLKSELPTALLMFPFYKDLGIYSTLHTQKQIWPEDSEIENIIYGKANQLIKRLELQSKEKSNIYYANIDEYFDLEAREVQIKLYQHSGEFIPVVMNGEQVAIRATELVCEPLNEQRRENLIMECLFHKLWDNKSSVLNYTTLKPYLDLVDYEDLAKDSRTYWADENLLNTIVERANQTCWRNISRHCDIQVLCDNIDRFQNYLDWPIFTERVNENFLIAHFKEYPWDLEVLSGDIDREDSVIEQLILIQKETEEDWNWDELEMRLSDSFVLAHLDIVKVSLRRFTNDTADVREAILSNVDKKWDWDKIEREFDLNFIYDNITSIGPHLSFFSLFDRVFTDETWANTFATSPQFQSVIAEESKNNGALTSAIFNDKDYIWIPSVIDLLESNGLLSWQSTPYMVGFECNPHLVWNKSLFERYSKFVITVDGQKFISQHIGDVDILIEHPTFNWNWEAISCNTNLLFDKKLYASFGEKLKWVHIFENHTDSSFFQSFENIDMMIGNDRKNDLELESLRAEQELNRARLQKEHEMELHRQNEEIDRQNRKADIELESLRAEQELNRIRLQKEYEQKLNREQVINDFELEQKRKEHDFELKAEQDRLNLELQRQRDEVELNRLKKEKGINQIGTASTGLGVTDDLLNLDGELNQGSEKTTSKKNDFEELFNTLDAGVEDIDLNGLNDDFKLD